jgi:hypothetical protein
MLLMTDYADCDGVTNRRPTFDSLTSLHFTSPASVSASASATLETHKAPPSRSGDSFIHHLLTTDKTKPCRSIAATLASRQLGQHGGDVDRDR